MLDLSPIALLRIIPAILLGLTVHELAHAWVAVSLGDETPRIMGRLTLNPLRHIDPIGGLLLVLVGFGWAKPVIIDRANLRRPIRDDLLISLAGPASNFVLALLLAFTLRLVMIAFPFQNPEAVSGAFDTFVVFVWINVGLGVFNLLPIPPLDGSHLISSLLDRYNPKAASVFRRVGAFALLAIILLDRMSEVSLLPIGRVIGAIGRALLGLARVI